MPYIRVSPSALSSMSETLRNSSSKVGRIENDFSAIAGKLDWDVRAASDIQRRLNQITGELEDQTRRLDKMYVFIGNAQQKYSKVQNGTNSDGKKWNDGFILNPSSFKNIWDLLKLPAHDAFHRYIRELNGIYLKKKAIWALDHTYDGFKWMDCKSDNKCVFGYTRTDGKQTLFAIFNFSDKEAFIAPELDGKVTMLLNTDWESFGGKTKKSTARKQAISIQPYTGMLFSCN